MSDIKVEKIEMTDVQDTAAQAANAPKLEPQSTHASLFSLSLSLILENFKMYWYLPALTFIAYFFGGIFPIIANRNHPEYITHNVSQYALNNLDVLYTPLLVLCPLIAACIVMSVFHNQNRCLFMHAKPYSRSRLFNSQVVTGWVMLVLPVIATALLYIVFRKDVCTGSEIAYWLCNSIVILTFFFGMFMLAGFLVGTTVMQILLSGVMFGIVPLVVFIINGYTTLFIDGFAGISDVAKSIMENSNPIFTILMTWGTKFSTELHIGYLLAGIIMLVLARVAYQKSRLEKVGDSMIFGIIEEIITYLIVFVGMSGFGFLIYSITGGSRNMFTFGMLIGALITFLVVKIIIAKSIKIFSKRNFKSLAIYIVIAAVFTGVFVYDITGFATRLPDRDKIEGVSLSSGTFISTYDTMYSCDSVLLKEDKSVRTVSDADVIDKMVELETYIVENDKYQKNASLYQAGYYTEETPYYENVEYETVTFTYKMKSGGTFERIYTVYLDDKIKEMINDIVTSDSWQDFYMYADNLDLSNVKDATIDVYSYDNVIVYEDDSDTYSEDTAVPAAEPVSDEGKIIDTETIMKLVKARDADCKNRTYYEMLGDSESYTCYDVNINVSFKTKVITENTITGGTDETYSSAAICFEVRNTDANTIAALKDIGMIG